MVSGNNLREVMGNFAAGVTVVTLPEPYHGITVNAFTSLSIEPILVLICLDNETEAHERLNSGVGSGFCVNILAADQQHLGEHFARLDELDYDPFVTERTRTSVSGAPIFLDAVGYLDCTIYDQIPGGDHTIYIGEVHEAEVIRESSPVLMYFRGDWGVYSNS